jgi:LPPG:FO 2-phospho-L-lactate transferase
VPESRNHESKGSTARPVVALCGGVGGAKLALGLYRVLEADALTLILNTGDDFEHLGLHISPDIDTVTYTLAGKNNPKTGWGRRDESWTFMEALAELGGETWFSLGDGDLAIHVERTRRLNAGESLSRITADFSRAFGISAHLLPMTDDQLRTVVETPHGALSFQDYFVRRQSKPVVERIVFEDAGKAVPSTSAMDALQLPDLRAVVICPSNPFLSIDPILALAGFRQALMDCKAPVIAVSPIIGGQAVKGPTAKIMTELSMPSTARAVAEYYGDLIDGFVFDQDDEAEASGASLPSLVTQTLMDSLEDRKTLASDILAFADELTTRPAEAGLAEEKQGKG